MAFGGAQVNTVIGPAAGPMGLDVTGLALGAAVGAFNLANADSGALTTDNTTTPANTNAIPANFGPGEGNWTQADVDAVRVVIDDSTVAANVRLALVSKVLTGGNLVVNVHNVDAGGLGVPAAIRVQLRLMHSSIRGN